MKNLLNSKKKWLALALMFVMLVTGCGNSGSDKTTDTNTTTDTTSSTADATETGTTTEEPAVIVDPLGKYEEPITVSTFFEIAPPIATVFTEDRIMNNVFQKQYLEELGINIEYLWFAAQSEEDSVQKKNIAIASGDLPDIMMVNKDQLALLSKSGLINRNIGKIFEQYASDHLKEWMYQEGTSAMDSATYAGETIAIPMTDSSIDTAPFTWIRKDWLDNLGLSVPTTMDEFYNVMVAFKNNDPDKNGANDTIGMILNNDFLTMASGDALGLFNGFGAFPRAWVKDASGKLVYGSIQPEVKDALAFLNKLYNEGLIEEDFGVKDVMKVSELPAAGTAGIQYGAMWNAMWPLQSSLDNDPNANWIPIAIPTATGEPAHPQIRLNIPFYYVVSAECKNPEALIKLLNFFVEKFAYSTGDEYAFYLTADNGPASFAIHETMFKTYNALKNLEAYWHVNDAFDNNDTSKLNAEEQSYYDSIVQFQGGDMSVAGSVKTFGKEGSFSVMDGYYKNDLFMMDQFFGAPTDTMKQKMQLINDKEMEYFTKAVMGVESLDTFDDFVAELNKLGLDQITKEVNEWQDAR